jgi:hypothetical protein
MVARFSAWLAALLATFALGACQAPEAPPPLPLGEARLDRAALEIEARHSEDARIGDLAGLLVSVSNRSPAPVDRIRIDVSAPYFVGLELRRTDPAPRAVAVGTGEYTFVFDGPRPGSRFGYLIVLTPMVEGEFPAEVTVSVLDRENRQNVLAIYDIRTRVSQRPMEPTSDG